MSEFEKLLIPFPVPVVNKDKQVTKKKAKPQTTALGQELIKWKEKINEQ
jgi:hypothetical protein